MKWFNHLLIAGSTMAAIKPDLIPVALIGSTAPDWLETVSKILGKRVAHRTVTHYLIYWIIGIVFGYFVYDYHYIFTAFCYGGFTHVIADSMTITGVPLGWWSDRRFHLFNGRLTTGGSGEYFVSFGICLVCTFIVQHTSNTEYIPFMFDWGKCYKEGLCSAQEWKQNRLRFF